MDNLVQNLNVQINNNSFNKELLFQIITEFSFNIILSIEKIMYKIFTDLKIEKTLNNDNSEEILHEYIKFYLVQYFQNLNSEQITTFDEQYIDKIKKIKNYNNKIIFNILEEIINLSYPFIVRNQLDISNIEIYCNNIKEQYNDICDINKLEILKLIIDV